jgi:hypothetical protein
MSPFWNHILAKKGRFIHVRSQISWNVCSMYLGTKEDFFLTHTFCALLPRCCALLCGSPLSYVCTVQFLILRILCWSTNCVHTSDHQFSRVKAKKKFWFHVRWTIEAKKTSRSLIHVIFISVHLILYMNSYDPFVLLNSHTLLTIWIHTFSQSYEFT